jgi:hypothetical protein
VQKDHALTGSGRPYASEKFKRSLREVLREAFRKAFIDADEGVEKVEKRSSRFHAADCRYTSL